MNMSEPRSKKSEKKKKKDKTSTQSVVTAQQPEVRLNVSQGATESSSDERRYIFGLSTKRRACCTRLLSRSLSFAIPIW